MNSLIVFGAKYLFITVVLIWVVAWLQAGRKHKLEIALATLIAGILAGLLDKIGSILYYDPRPFVTHHIQPLVSHAADNGFPSEHTLLSVTLASVLVFYRPKVGMTAFVVALIVGVARVAAHVHSPIDIAGSAIFGIAAGYIGYLLAPKLLAANSKR